MAKNNTQSKKADEECKSDCSSCVTASSCSSEKKGQAGLPPKAAIDVKHVIMVLSGKGGVGKTTTTANVGTGLALLGKKVVLIDTDIGLRNLDVVMGLENRIVYDLVEIVEENCRIKQAIIKDKRFESSSISKRSIRSAY